MAYSSHLSWQTETTPVPLEVYPAQVFDSLFENRSGRRDQSILDGAALQSSVLLKKVGRNDQHKLDEYLTSVREVEKRLQRRSLMPNVAGPTTATGAKMNRPTDGIPIDITEHMRLMCDLLALAFQTDRTRLATLILCRDLSGMTYPFMGIRKAHHPSGSIPTGRALDYFERNDDRRKMCSLYLSLADRMLPESARLAEFGDASERLVDFQKHHVVISAHTR